MWIYDTHLENKTHIFCLQFTQGVAEGKLEAKGIVFIVLQVGAVQCISRMLGSMMSDGSLNLLYMYILYYCIASGLSVDVNDYSARLLAVKV